MGWGSPLPITELYGKPVELHGTALLGEKLVSLDARGLGKEGFKVEKGNVRWVGNRSKYFVAALVPESLTVDEVAFLPAADNSASAWITGAATPGSLVVRNSRLYAGPLHFEPCPVQRPRQKTCDAGVRITAHPQDEEPLHALAIARMPDERVPIGIDHNRAGARAQHAGKLAHRDIEIRNEEIHLNSGCNIDARVRTRQRSSIGQAKFDLPETCAPRACDIQHRLARVDGNDPALRADLPRHFEREITRPAADVEHGLTRLQRHGFERLPALLHQCGCGILPLDALRALEAEHAAGGRAPRPDGA